MSLETLLIRIDALGPGRKLIALAGPPASGKSTLAAKLGARLSAPVVGLDGFHYDNAVLDARGLRARKGAPESFDAAGFAAMIARLKAGGEVAVPVFDRDADLARSSAVIVPAGAERILVEGNYLLLDRAPWNGIAYDLTIMLAQEDSTLRARLNQRWQNRADAQEQIEDNDLVNAATVRRESRAADLTLTQVI